MIESLARRGMDSLVLCQKARQHWQRRTEDGRLVEARRSRFYRRAWEEAAAATGASLTHLDETVTEISVGGHRLLVSDSTTSLDDPVTLRIAGDKPLVYRLLGAQGVPVPRHVVCPGDDLSSAWRFVSRTREPCVVKPARNTGRGNGVTAGVTSRRGLVGALALAASYCGDVVIEEQVWGGNYRLLYFDGELLDAVLRCPPVVRGDGIHTLRELIAAENRDRMRGGIETSQTLLPLDRELRKTLRESSFRLRSVPPAGDLVRLKTVISDNRREDNVPASHRLCASVVESGATAARAVGARLAGVDVITPDAAVPLSECGGAIIEVNTTPGHYFHYAERSDPGAVARMILERLAGSAT